MQQDSTNILELLKIQKREIVGLNTSEKLE